MSALQFTTHESLAICRVCDVKRDEYLDYMTFRANERPLFTEIFGPLIGLKEEWVAQGATPGELDFSAFRYRCPAEAGLGLETGFIGGQAEQVLENTPEYTITRDMRGRRTKLCKGAATIALPMDYPVKNMDDWLKVKDHYLFCEERVPKHVESICRKATDEGRAVTVDIPGGFDEPRELMGEENACLAFYDQPELVHDMLNTIADTALKVFERVIDRVQIDELSVHEDLAGKSGPLVGPRQVREFMVPYYRRIWDFLQAHGVRLFKVDSDGNINPIIEDMLAGGVNCLYPMEPAAGMDIVQVRQKYGNRLAMMGGIDKHIIRRSKDEIVAELEYKVPPMVRTGGCVLGLDHRIPNGTPLENYRFYVRKMWEILKRPR